MQWTEYTTMRRHVAAYNPRLAKLEKAAEQANAKIVTLEEKNKVVPVSLLKDAYKKHAALLQFLMPYMKEAKANGHGAYMLLAPKNLKPYMKNGVVSRELKITIAKLSVLHRWSSRGLKKLANFAPKKK